MLVTPLVKTIDSSTLGRAARLKQQPCSRNRHLWLWQMIKEETVILRLQFNTSHISSIPVAPNFQWTTKFKEFRYKKQKRLLAPTRSLSKKLIFLPTLIHLSFFFLKNYLLKIFYRKKIKEYKYLRKLLATDNLFLFHIF